MANGARKQGSADDWRSLGLTRLVGEDLIRC